MPPMKRLTGGRIAGLYVGNNKGTVKRPVSSLLLTLDGMEGDAHAGRTQKTGAREPAFRRGTMVANSSKQLFDFIGRIESLEAEKTEAGDKIKAEKALAKAAGFDMKAFNQLLKERKGDMIKTMQNRAIVETYRRALGQYADTELGQWALNSISEQAKMRLEGAKSQFRGPRLVEPGDKLN